MPAPPLQHSAAPLRTDESEAAPKALRVVAIGGGTGLSTLLRGLKRYVHTPPGSQPLSDSRCKDAACLIRDLAAVVTVTDDGGSSGRLREDFKMLPPGDVRNCMVALSEDEHLLSKLFQFRFDQGDLQGHSFGNLFVAALSHITGDFAQAVGLSSQILATRGRIYPATNHNVTLSARMDDGSDVHGETNITASKRRIEVLTLEPPDAPPLPDALDAIRHADLVTLGPGSLYTSLITNLLVRGIPEALAETRATRVYVCNLMTQANESLGLTASEHIEKNPAARPRHPAWFRSAQAHLRLRPHQHRSHQPQAHRAIRRRRPATHRTRPRPHPRPRRRTHHRQLRPRGRRPPPRPRPRHRKTPRTRPPDPLSSRIILL